MERAIKDLCQRNDSDLFEEVATGIGHIVEAVNELDAAMRKLAQSNDRDRPSMLGNYPAKILENLADEEASKVLILLDAVRCPRNRKEMSRTLEYFHDHLAKGIYAEVCKWRKPATFDEIEKYVDYERTAYYLDGPNGVEWIFPNQIKQSREDALYVGYYRDDSDEGIPFWNPPFRNPIVPHFASPVVQVSRALHHSGVTTPTGLEVVAKVWRSIEMCPETQWGERERLNACTLDVLKQRGVLVGEDGAHEVIHRLWPFPLWSLDLRELPLNGKERKLAKNRLRDIRRTLCLGG